MPSWCEAIIHHHLQRSRDFTMQASMRDDQLKFGVKLLMLGLTFFAARGVVSTTRRTICRTASAFMNNLIQASLDICNTAQ